MKFQHDNSNKIDLKVSGAMEHQLPLQLPPEGDNFVDGNSQGSSFDLSIGDLKEMEEIYQNVVSEYQSLLTLYANEEETSLKAGKTEDVPKSILSIKTRRKHVL